MDKVAKRQVRQVPVTAAAGLWHDSDERATRDFRLGVLADSSQQWPLSNMADQFVLYYHVTDKNSPS